MSGCSQGNEDDQPAQNYRSRILSNQDYLFSNCCTAMSAMSHLPFLTPKSALEERSFPAGRKSAVFVLFWSIRIVALVIYSGQYRSIRCKFRTRAMVTPSCQSLSKCKPPT